MSEKDKQQLSNHANFYCESTIPVYDFIFFKPSTIALSSVVLASYVLQHDPWPPSLQHHTGKLWQNSALRNCVELLQNSVLFPPFPTEAIAERFSNIPIVAMPRESIFVQNP